MTAIDRAAEVYPDMDEKSPSALTYPPDAVTQFQRGAYLRGWKESRASIDTDALMDVIANLPCDPSEGCTCTHPGQLHVGADLGESIAQAVKAHLLGGERP